MPYTNSWSTTIPSGTTPANLIDDHIRQLRLDIQERLLELFNSPFTSDPLVVQPRILGNATKQVYYHWSCLNLSEIPDSDITASNKSFRFNPVLGTKTLRCPIDIPVGCTISTIKMLCNPQNKNISFSLNRSPFASTANNPVAITAFFSGSGSSDVIVDSGSINHVVLASNIYYIVLSIQGGADIMGFEITYTTPDCRNTR